ncbi:MAG: carboxymuconolactone decarboxylase family protein [Actinobacteria bacterium]|nr:carboxymuconolactone decarboxylase family protein [Actinomycetota bacterium]
MPLPEPSAGPAVTEPDGSFLAPVEKPRGLPWKVMYWYSRRRWGKVPRPFSVFAVRMPIAFGNFFGKVSKLDKKLALPADTAMLVRARVAGLNMCMWCVDGQRWFVGHETPEELPKLDAVGEYRTSPLFDERQRAALDYATELTEHKRVTAATFARLAEAYSEREICEIAWLVSSEHLYNLNNLGLGIGSDGLCEVTR